MRFLIKLASITTFALMTGCTADSKPEARYGQLKVEGAQLLSEAGEPVVLRGISYGWSAWWPRFYNAGTVKEFTDDWGVDVVRAAVSLNFDPSENSYLDDPEGTEKLLYAVVDAAIDNGIYVIIDWHSHKLLEEEATQFFVKMATKYGEYPNVIYEIFNEPVKQSWAEVKAYSENVIAAIREIDADNIILVGNPHWDQDVHIVADDPIEGVSNIMYTLHYYAATHRDYLIDRGNYAISKGTPLFISECAGMEATGDGPIDYDSWSRWVEWSEENNVSYVKWSVADKDETCSMLYPTAESDGGWDEDDLKEWGAVVRKLMREKAGLK
ncbi:MAG: glycoside hydrolase family 5 protein [Verrucomicrobiota bacterium]